MIPTQHHLDTSSHVWKLATGPLHGHVPVKLHWLRAIPLDRGTQYQRARLTQSMKGLMVALIDLGGASGPLAAGSMFNYFGEMRRVVAWMTGKGIWSFRDLKPRDIVDYFVSIQEDRKRPLCENTIWAKESLFKRMWHLRDKYLMPLQFDPLVICSPLEFLSQSEVEVGEQFDTVLDRRNSAESFMGTVVVVSVQPIGRHVTHLLQ